MGASARRARRSSPSARPTASTRTCLKRHPPPAFCPQPPTRDHCNPERQHRGSDRPRRPLGRTPPAGHQGPRHRPHRRIPALIWLALQPEPPAQARTSILACGHHGVIGMVLWSPAGTAGCRYWPCSPLESSPGSLASPVASDGRCRPCDERATPGGRWEPMGRAAAGRPAPWRRMTSADRPVPTARLAPIDEVGSDISVVNLVRQRHPPRQSE
jgi:hypothetical protein